MTVEMEVK